jgi:hypothetical protein
MNKIFAVLPLLILVGCGDIGNSSETNSNSNNEQININSGEASNLVCEGCNAEDEDKLADSLLSFGIDLEGLINCSVRCDLPANGDPVKVQCDRDCIKERALLGQKKCLRLYGCSSLPDAELEEATPTPTI